MLRARSTRFGMSARCTLAAVAVLVACGARAGAEGAQPLRVGIAPNYPPLAFKEDGQLKGIEVDFAKRLGPALGREVVLVETPWEDLPKALLEDKTIDIVMSGTSITKERQKKVDFTTPYLEVGQMVLVREADYPQLRDPAAMDRPTSRVGFVSRTTGAHWAEKHLRKAKLHGYADTNEGVAALQNDQIDFFIQDAPAVWRVTGGFFTENRNLKGLYRPLTKEYLAWAVAKNNPRLLQQLNGVLAKWKKDGTVDDVLDDWITVRKTSIEVVPHHK